MILRILIDATTRLFMLAVATYLALRWLEVPPRADRYIEAAILVVVWWQIGRWLSAAVRHLIETRRGQ